MPQLDKVTFLSQFFWLLFFFFGFYIVTLKNFLPRMCRILSYRNKRCVQSQAFPEEKENQVVSESSEKLLQTLVGNTKQIWKDTSVSSERWVQDYTRSFARNSLKRPRIAYIGSIVAKSFSKDCLLVLCAEFKNALYNTFSPQEVDTIRLAAPASSSGFSTLFSAKPILNDRNLQSESRKSKHHSRIIASLLNFPLIKKNKQLRDQKKQRRKRKS